MGRAPSRGQRPGFSRRAQYGLLITWTLAIAGAVVGAALLALSRFDPPAFAAMRSAATEATAPVSAALAAGARGVAAAPQTIATYLRVHGENADLRAELARNRRLLTRARVVGHENLRLRRLLQVRDATEEVVVAARIVSSSASSTRRFGVLNAGRWQGVRPGQPVRGPVGLIGRVVETGPSSARVLLLTDPESIVPVRRTRDGRPALAAGRGDGWVDVRPVDTGDPGFRRGDLFVTTGAGGIYAPGVPVATVERRTIDGGLARPVASPDALDFALVTRAFLPPPPQPRPTAP